MSNEKYVAQMIIGYLRKNQVYEGLSNKDLQCCCYWIQLAPCENGITLKCQACRKIPEAKTYADFLKPQRILKENS